MGLNKSLLGPNLSNRKCQLQDSEIDGSMKEDKIEELVICSRFAVVRASRLNKCKFFLQNTFPHLCDDLESPHCLPDPDYRYRPTKGKFEIEQLISLLDFHLSVELQEL
jgi:hypothetical protein